MTPNPSERLHGIDIARTCAICGMFVVHAFLVLGPPSSGLSGWERIVFNLTEGRAAATFVLLAGLGVGQLLSRRETTDSRRVLWRRALFLGVLGVLNLIVWPGDILRLYGVALLAAPWLHRWSSKALSWLVVALIFIFPLAAVFVDWDARWDWATLTYRGLWTPSGFALNLVVDGFRPLLPWLAFFVLGLRLARLDWRDSATQRRMLWAGICLFVLSELVSAGLVKLAIQSAMGEHLGENVVTALLGTHSLPSMPLFMLSALGIASLVLGGSFVLGNHLARRIREALVSTGRLALTWYLGHVLLLVGLSVAGYGNRLSALAAMGVALAGFAVVIAVSYLRGGAPMLLERMLRRFSTPSPGPAPAAARRRDGEAAIHEKCTSSRTQQPRS
ncbi:DUF1624 domain-containing protein [Myxococcus xanthus]|uniref:DUF418 domain-containing protein n=1 Tax=Myxococcus xanthus TaxID=34 RepID=UPI001916F857|nr:heparan-alpha-glucosaminide N-acetyltransferase domain-containing protein [Myxococcus xanthus]QQR46102.1 DUF1624 domain-containing protein [Myxococcus xanthus]